MPIQYDPRVRRGKLLAKATISPAGLVAGGILAAIGLATPLTWPWIAGAAVGGWLTSVALHLRDPKLVSALLAPDFNRDLGALDAEHRRYMVAGLQARDRFEQTVASLSDADDFAGMKVRVNDALERLYDSLVWAQRAAGFLRTVNPASIRQRAQGAGPGTRLSQELEAQLEEVDDVERRRNEILSRSAATITGIETLSVKVGTLALETSAPGMELDHVDDVRQLRSELDGYLQGLEEIQDALKTLPPQTT
jgi:hypothetical protein